MTAEATSLNCTLPSPVPAPTFPNGKTIGSPAQVQITCKFRLITPVIGTLIGNPLNVSASAAFPIRNGAINGIPLSTSLPSATPSAAPTGTPTPTVAPTPTPSPTPAPCIVPNLVGLATNQAPNKWNNQANFTSSLIFNPLVGPGNNYSIGHQSLAAGTSWVCSTTMTVRP